MIEIRDLARNKWRSILPALGVAATFLTGKNGPCPVCGGRDRFVFDDKDGRGTFFCRQACGAGDGVSLLMKSQGWTFGEAADRIREIAGDMPAGKPKSTISGDRALENCRRLLQNSSAIQPGDAVSRYLASRGLSGPYPADLRIVTACAVQGHPTASELTAMVAIVRDPAGCGASVHRTYLENGAKAMMDSPRKMMPGTIPDGSAIRLADFTDILGIGEGIETARGVTRDFGMPCWAAANATLLEKFIWPDGLAELHIFGDNDANFAGQASAYILARRAASHPRGPAAVYVHIPPDVDTDWLDHGNVRRVA